jgi:Holliday junction resolvase RusA-like endonuclease
MWIEIVVPGKPITSNHQSRITVFKASAKAYKGRMYKSAAAKAYQGLVFRLSYEQAQRMEWEQPYYAAVEVCAINIRGDVDGILKLILDGCQGAFYSNDSRIKSLRVELSKRLGEEPHVVIRARALTWSECKTKGLSVPVKYRA